MKPNGDGSTFVFCDAHSGESAISQNAGKASR
jgi:hypothetical protein